jgi:methyltransferase (TIGR00027 family)
MIEARPSITATRVAMRRAAHQLVDRPLVFDDPLAVRILNHPARNKLAGEMQRENMMALRMRAWLAARSRLAEDTLAEEVAAGVEQYVVLGAGLDTFAYRNPWPQLRVFEVDYPSTQKWKHELLANAEIAIPETVTYAPVDFERESLQDGLARAGFNLQQPAFFSWLGVTMYLARETTLSTLRWVRQIHPRNGIVFDYAVPRESLDFLHRVAFDALAFRVARAGEPFLGFFTTQELPTELRAMGYQQADDWDGDRLNARYFANRADKLKVAGHLSRFMRAL